MSKLLYLDNAATTKTAPEVVEAMLPYFTEKFGNPSSVYSFAAANKEVINQQRDTIAEMIGAKTNEIYFTDLRRRRKMRWTFLSGKKKYKNFLKL